MVEVNRDVGNVRCNVFERTKTERGNDTQQLIPYLSDDRHEIRLINILLDVLKFWLFGIRIRIMINERHEAFAIFLRQDVLLLSHAGVQINLVPERINEGANRSLLVGKNK